MSGKEESKKSVNYGENKHIGNQGEYYCRSLYGLMKHPDGERRPDLISVNGRYSPKLSMEIKSSMSGRGIINPHGLTYGFSSNLDYIGVFGDDLPKENPSDLIEDMEYNRFRNISPSAFYYNLMQRTDGLRNEEFRNEFDDLKIKFGDQIIVPHELIFYAYVIDKMRGNGKTFETSKEEVKEIVTSFLTRGYDYYNPGKNDCQPIRFSDYLALYMNDDSLIVSPEGKKRVELLRKHYGEDRIESFEKIEYIGPNNTNIYAFYRPEHSELFREQIKNRIGERRGILTKLSEKRIHAIEGLERKISTQEDLFGKSQKVDISSPMPEDNENIERLLKWKRKEDKGPEFDEIHPDGVEKEEIVKQVALF